MSLERGENGPVKRHATVPSSGVNGAYDEGGSRN